MASNLETEKLYEDLAKLIGEADQETVKKFLLEHIKEFPDRDQEDIVAAFLDDELNKEKTEDEAILDFQNKTLALFDKLEAEKKALEDRDRLLEMKENL